MLLGLVLGISKVASLRAANVASNADLSADTSNTCVGVTQGGASQSAYLISSNLDHGYQSANPANKFHVDFTQKGIHLIPLAFQGSTPPWEWGLTLNGYGTEWYVNSASGLKQGFTLQTPPRQQGDGDIVLELTLDTNMISYSIEDGTAFEFFTDTGVGGLQYRDLIVYDANGRLLPSHMELQSQTIRLIFDTENATYPITVDPHSTCPTCH